MRSARFHGAQRVSDRFNAPRGRINLRPYYWLRLYLDSARAQHRVLQGLGRGKAQPRACWNLNLRTSRRITAHPRLRLALAKNSEASQPQRSLTLEFADYQRRQFVEC